jgi:hypothetical protein
MMVVMPILSLEEMPHRQPVYIPTRVLAWLYSWSQMARAVDKALPVQGEHQTDGAKPKEGCHTYHTATKIGNRE